MSKIEELVAEHYKMWEPEKIQTILILEDLREFLGKKGIESELDPFLISLEIGPVSFYISENAICSPFKVNIVHLSDPNYRENFLKYLDGPKDPHFNVKRHGVS